MTARATERRVAAKSFTFTLRTTNRTTFGITVSHTGDVVVRGPHGATDEQAIDLVHRRREWIYRQLKHFKETAPDSHVKELIGGTGFTVLGHGHRLRIVADTDQDQPLVHHRWSERGPWLHMRSTTARNAEAAREELVTFYARTGQEWLDAHAPSITRQTTSPDLPVKMSTRMRTNWVYLHPTRGLTLHWATAQLSTVYIRELIHRTLGLPSVTHNHSYERALRTLWIGDLKLHRALAPTAQPCRACSAAINTLHAENCSSALCARTGRQRSDCGHPDATCNTVWSGQHPHLAACIEYGFFCRATSDGYEPCDAHDPRALPDYNRVYRECRWSAAEQRMVLDA
ncbi:YgjP-like metallopeptidase domain-containing protein [Streptomyces cinnamoneus]|uniref:YgjP-like metallopeptidase domain-containing protein n=1 Tax=Streptomyces cinnamoneus TaxID=53446 RepID=UPI0033E0D79A